MLSRELKLGIIGGVISSILVIVFIQPIFSFVWEAIISFGESVQAGYVDRIYKNAAIGERNLSGNLLLLVLVIILLSYPLFILLKEYANRYEINDLMSSLINVVISFLILMLSALIMVFASISVGVMEINASFNQRLTVIAPSIDDKEIKEWRAQWAKMEGLRDYQTLTTAMENRAVELNITLPKLRNP
ncbi:hypothetical protein [Aeromonas veronii]|uniref:hypothetical protein n=1 Tax=Aeromonas veronii TaxID=654 RepID=UPI003F744A9A